MAELNDAYEAVRNPEARANVLLAVLGGPTKEENNSLPQGFLMEIMETREALESAMQAGDATAIDQGLQAARSQRESFISGVKALFSDLPRPASAGSLAELRTQLNAWRYVERLIEQVDDNPDRGR